MRLDCLWVKVIEEFPAAHVMIRYDPERERNRYTAVIDLDAELPRDGATFRRDGETASTALMMSYHEARQWIPLPRSGR